MVRCTQFQQLMSLLDWESIEVNNGAFTQSPTLNLMQEYETAFLKFDKDGVGHITKVMAVGSVVRS